MKERRSLAVPVPVHQLLLLACQRSIMMMIDDCDDDFDDDDYLLTICTQANLQVKIKTALPKVKP